MKFTSFADLDLETQKRVVTESLTTRPIVHVEPMKFANAFGVHLQVGDAHAVLMSNDVIDLMEDLRQVALEFASMEQSSKEKH